jgi:hypothetical protein
MNPKLLISLACEKVHLASGEGMIKRLSLHPLSCNLYVYMYWFVHCRFFQPDSTAEQTYLLSKVAVIYTQLLSVKALQAHKDFFFKNYPFVQSSAIILGFKYLCPGNQSLYTPTFKRIVFKTIATLLSGVDICPGSIDAIRRGMYPDDVDTVVVDAKDKSAAALSNNTLPPLPFAAAREGDGKEGQGPQTPGANALPTGGILHADGEDVVRGGRPGLKKREVPERQQQQQQQAQVSSYRFDVTTLSSSLSTSFLISDSSIAGTTSELSRSHRSFIDTSADALTLRSVLPPVSKFTGARETLRFRPDKPSQLGSSILPRQQQVVFDASGISPLLRQYLVSDGSASESGGPATTGTLGKSQFLRRTEPVKWCKTGGVDTHRKIPSRREAHDAIRREYRQAKKAFAKGVVGSMRVMARELSNIEQERTTLFRSGAIGVGKKAFDVAKDIEARSHGGRGNGEPAEGGDDLGETSVFRRLPTYDK